MGDESPVFFQRSFSGELLKGHDGDLLNAFRVGGKGNHTIGALFKVGDFLAVPLCPCFIHIPGEGKVAVSVDGFAVGRELKEFCFKSQITVFLRQIRHTPGVGGESQTERVLPVFDGSVADISAVDGREAEGKDLFNGHFSTSLEDHFSKMDCSISNEPASRAASPYSAEASLPARAYHREPSIRSSSTRSGQMCMASEVSSFPAWSPG